MDISTSKFLWVFFFLVQSSMRSVFMTTVYLIRKAISKLLFLSKLLFGDMWQTSVQLVIILSWFCFLEYCSILSLWQIHMLNFTNPFPSVLSRFFRLTGEWQLVHKPTATSSGAGTSTPLQWWSCSDSSFIMENYFKQHKTAEPHFFHVSATITPAIDKMSKFIAE